MKKRVCAGVMLLTCLLLAGGVQAEDAAGAPKPKPSAEEMEAMVNPLPADAASGNDAKTGSTEAGAVQAAKSPETAVSPFERRLQEAGIKYTRNSSGNFRMTWTVKEAGEGRKERTHCVVANAEPQTFAGMTVREVWAIAYQGPRLTRNLLAESLIDNGTRKVGAWEIAVNDESKTENLIFTMRIPADLPAADLRTVCSSVAETADAVEERLDGGDDL